MRDYRYSREELFALNNNTLRPHPGVSRTIRLLGLPRRGCRAGKHVRRRRGYTLTGRPGNDVIQVITGNRPATFQPVHDQPACNDVTVSCLPSAAEMPPTTRHHRYFTVTRNSTSTTTTSTT